MKPSCPSRGHYLTLQIGDYPVIVLRSDDGEILAFHNTCRHRGSRVCTAAKGKAARLVCPYHQWSYGLDGRLIRGRRMGEGFDPAPLRASKRVHARSVGGLIFVCVADEAPDFEPFHALVEPYLAPHRLGEAKVAHRGDDRREGQLEAGLGEQSRVLSLRRQPSRAVPDVPRGGRTSSAPGARRNTPRSLALWDRCERAGLPSRFRDSADGEHRVVRMPLVGDAVSYTMTGAAAVGPPAGRDRRGPDRHPHAVPLSLDLAARAGRPCRAPSSVLPLGPRETAATPAWLVHKDAVEGVDYAPEDLTRVWRATNDQDRRVVEENQRGISSPAYEPGPYAPEDEAGVEVRRLVLLGHAAGP